MSLEKMRRKCQQLTDEERMAILQKATAGTLALLGDNDYPYAVPISYAYHEGKQYFHIALAGHKVDAIRKCAKGTCFLFVYPYLAHLPTQNLLSDAECKICKYDCRQKKKMQTSAKSISQFFARLHFLTQIFAHSCNRC